MSVKSEFETSLELLINFDLSQKRSVICQKQLEDCNTNLEMALRALQKSMKGNTTSITLYDHKPSSVGILLREANHLGEENDRLQTDIDFEKRYTQSILKQLANKKIQNFFREWLKEPFKEKRILVISKKIGFIIHFITAVDGSLPKVFTSNEKLQWLKVEDQKIIPDLFTRTQAIDKFKPRDKKTHKVDIELKHHLIAKECESCQRTFYTFTKTRQYCSDVCVSKAYNDRRKEKRHEMGAQLKNIKNREQQSCPICNEQYSGSGRTCGNETCRKAEYRKRKKTSS